LRDGEGEGDGGVGLRRLPRPEAELGAREI